MAIVRNRLETTLSLIKRDLKEGTDQWMWYTQGTFMEFSSDVYESSYRSSIKDATLKRNCAIMHKQLGRIKEDLDTLLTMCAQASWQKRMVREGHLDTFDNMLYGTALADAFITKYRSAYDTIAMAFRALTKSPDEAYLSFTDLRNVNNNKNILRVYGNDLTQLIRECDWYDLLVTVRDEIVHRSLKSKGFMHARILFQITKLDRNKNQLVNLIDIREVMANKNLVDFELYAAVNIAYTFWLLEKFAEIGYSILKPVKSDNAKGAKKLYPGLDVFNDSLERVLATPPPPPQRA